MTRAGIYVHFPFCGEKCGYCDFYSGNFLSLKDKYTAALIKELSLFKNGSFDTIYFGGGNPVLIGRRNLKRIINFIFKNFNIKKDFEFTVEINPEDIKEDTADFLIENNINRVSVGIQSVYGDILKTIQRKEVLLKKLKYLRKTKNINFDLIIGVKGLDKTRLEKQIDFLTGFNPKHFSVYILDIHKKTPLYKSYKKYPDLFSDGEAARQYKIISGILKKRGFIHYEISNFAKKGFFCRHNLKYWNLNEWLGIGAGAYGNFEGKRYFNRQDIKLYVKNPILARRYERISSSDKIKDYIIMALRKKEGIDLITAPPAVRNHIEQKEEKINELIKKGFFKKTKTSLFIPESKFLVSNGIISDLI